METDPKFHVCTHGPGSSGLPQVGVRVSKLWTVSKDREVVGKEEWTTIAHISTVSRPAVPKLTCLAPDLPSLFRKQGSTVYIHLLFFVVCFFVPRSHLSMLRQYSEESFLANLENHMVSQRWNPFSLVPGNHP